MPTVAPVPADVLQLQVRFLVGSRTPSIGHWLWDPGGLAPGVSELEDVLGRYLLNCLPYISDVVHTAVRLSDITAQQAGLRAVSGFDFFTGIWDGAQQLGTTHGWHWLAGGGRRSSAALSHLPGTPDAFVTDDGALSHTGYANLRDRGHSYLAELASLPTPTGGFYVPIILHRRSNAGALPAAIPSPIQGVAPMLALSTINRRMSKPRGISPA